MFRTRFWPMTAKPISPMSQLSFSIHSPGDLFLRRSMAESSFYPGFFVGRPPRLAFFAKGADTLGKIGCTKKLLAELLRRIGGLLPAQSACFINEPKPGVHGFRAGGS